MICNCFSFLLFNIPVTSLPVSVVNSDASSVSEDSVDTPSEVSSVTLIIVDTSVGGGTVDFLVSSLPRLVILILILCYNICYNYIYML